MKAGGRWWCAGGLRLARLRPQSPGGVVYGQVVLVRSLDAMGAYQPIPK